MTGLHITQNRRSANLVSKKDGFFYDLAMGLFIGRQFCFFAEVRFRVRYGALQVSKEPHKSWGEPVA